jgi:hypothetical protein
MKNEQTGNLNGAGVRDIESEPDSPSYSSLIPHPSSLDPIPSSFIPPSPPLDIDGTLIRSARTGAF